MNAEMKESWLYFVFTCMSHVQHRVPLGSREHFVALKLSKCLHRNSHSSALFLDMHRMHVLTGTPFSNADHVSYRPIN